MANSANKVPIRETFQIPSRGKIYTKYEVPESFTIRAMTTAEEKMRLAGNGSDTIPNIIKACLLDPEDFDVSKLTLFDIQFLMYKLRIVTYGSAYEYRIRCQNCERENNIVTDLNTIPVNYVDDDLKDVFEIGPLPVSGDVLECKILSAADYYEIEKEAKRLRAKMPDYVGDPEFILGYQYRIQKVNGSSVIPAKLKQYIEEMSMRDTRYLDSKYSDVANGLGMDLTMTETCKYCGSEMNYVLPTTSEFFRPKY